MTTTTKRPPPKKRKAAKRQSPAGTKIAAKKVAARKKPTKGRPAAKKAVAKRPTPKKPAATKTVARKPSPKKAVAKRAPARKTTSGRAPVKKTAARKAPPRKAVARRAPPKKTAARKAPPRKAPPRKAVTERSATQRSTAGRARELVSDLDARRPAPLRPTKKQYAAPVVAPIAMPRKTLAATVHGERLGAMLMLLFLALTLFGLVMVLSASSVSSLYSTDGSPFEIFRRQAVWAVLGAVSFVLCARIDYRWIQTITTPLLGTSLALLVAVLIPGLGSNLNGSSRWLDIGPIVIQPAELAKLSLIVFCADLLTRRQKHILDWKLTLGPVMVVVGLFSGLLLLQPKLGTPIVMATIAFLMLFIAGAKLSNLSVAAGIGVLAATFFTFSADYRYRRITAFLDPWSDQYGLGRQIIQSQVGIASGGLLGVGLGASRAKWGFLPYASSDFIFTVVAEEIGLLGGAALILAFLTIGYLGMRAAVDAPEPFGMLLAAGITCWLMVQAFLNIGMAMGQLPITGEPLPFVSAGGSSLVTTLAAAGLLTNVARRGRSRRPT